MMAISRISWISSLRFVIAALLLTAGLAKVVGGYDTASAIPRFAFWPIVLLEVVIAAGLLRRKRWAAGGVVLMAVGGVMLSLLVPHRTCGCLGNLAALDTKLHLLLASSLGFAGTLLLVDPGATSLRPD